MIYQGVLTGELAKLETSHLNLEEGKIYIPSTKRSNARTFKLNPNQVMHLHRYTADLQPGYLFSCEKTSDKAHLTQKQLAEKLNVKRTYISKIERASSDVRLSTLRKIIETGLGGKLRISVEL